MIRSIFEHAEDRNCRKGLTMKLPLDIFSRIGQNSHDQWLSPKEIQFYYDKYLKSDDLSRWQNKVKEDIIREEKLLMLKETIDAL